MFDVDAEPGYKRMRILDAYTRQVCVTYLLSAHVHIGTDHGAVAREVRRRAEQLARDIEPTRPFELHFERGVSKPSDMPFITKQIVYYTVHFPAQAIIED